MHRLALELGKFVREVETQMSAAEFRDWLRYFTSSTPEAPSLSDMPDEQIEKLLGIE